MRVPENSHSSRHRRVGTSERWPAGVLRRNASPLCAMAQHTVAPRRFLFPVPESVDDETAAALPNPGVSAWLSLAYRAQLKPGEMSSSWVHRSHG